MGISLAANAAVLLETNITGQAPTFANLAGGGFVALADKPGNGTGLLQIFSDAGAPVGAQIALDNYAGQGGDSFGVLRLAGLTGGGFVAITTDGTAQPGQTDVVARVYSATGALQAKFIVDNAPTGATEFAPSVVATANGGFQVLWTDDSSRGSTTFTAVRPNPPDTQSVTEGRDVYVHGFAPVNGVWQSQSPADVPVNAPGFFTDAGDQQTETWTQTNARLANGNVVVAYHDVPPYNGSNGYFNQWAFSDGVSFNVLGPDGSTVVGRTVVRNDVDSTAQNGFGFIGDASVAAAGSGFAYLWDERDIPQNADYYQGVHLQMFNADGTAASAQTLVSPVGTNASYGKATGLANGAVVVLYQTENPNALLVTRDLFMAVYDATGHQLQAPTLVTDSLLRPGGSYYPQANYAVSTRADGSVQIVYDAYDAASGQTSLKSQVFTVTATVDLPAAVSTAVANVLRVDPNAASSQALDATLVNQTTAAAVAKIVAAAVPTTSVADLAYQFFTGKTPGAAGIDYLVSPTGPNPNNLNSAYYAQFNATNRYINFASNLGKIGEGAAGFQSTYGALSLTDATTKAYAAIFGTTPTADKVNHLLHDLVPNGVGGTYEREAYFASYGQDGLNGQGTKAAMVGWLLSQAAQADLGTYAKSNDAFLTDVANSHATFGVDLIGSYAQPGYAYTGG